MSNGLVSFWSEMDFEGPLFVHPQDRKYLKAKGPKFLDQRPENFESHINGTSFGRNEKRMHFSLYPGPYSGDLKRADVFILLLNPGFSPLNYYIAQNYPQSLERQKKTLAQDFSDADFPNHLFDPELCWTGGYQWWERKFRALGIEWANAQQKTYLEVLKELSNRVASIELIPYHSQSFGAGKLVKDLPSAQMARAFVKDELLPRAKAGDVALVVTRQVKAWDIGDPLDDRYPNIVQYTGGKARGASLGPNTDGGKAILRQLNKRHPNSL